MYNTTRSIPNILEGGPVVGSRMTDCVALLHHWTSEGVPQEELEAKLNQWGLNGDRLPQNEVDIALLVHSKTLTK